MQRTDESGGLRKRLSRRGYEIFRARELYPGEEEDHSHEYYEVALIWSGSMHYRVGNRSYYLTSGDILLIAPGESHRPEPETEPGSCERMLLRLDRQCMQQLRSFGFDPAACFCADGSGGGEYLRFDDDAALRIGELMDRCLREYESENFGAAMMADTTMIQVMILINRLYRRSLRGGRRDRSGTLVQEILNYINSHYAEELSLDGLANRFFISKYHLSREFGRITGISVHRYIVQKRLAVAKQLLSEGRSLSMVWQSCGFGDYSNFYRAFRGTYGISPKAYVAALREDNGIADFTYAQPGGIL